MATSVISQTNQECYYDGPDPCFAIYGFEYKEGFDDGVSALLEPQGLVYAISDVHAIWDETNARRSTSPGSMTGRRRGLSRRRVWVRIRLWRSRRVQYRKSRSTCLPTWE